MGVAISVLLRISIFEMEEIPIIKILVRYAQMEHLLILTKMNVFLFVEMALSIPQKNVKTIILIMVMDAARLVKLSIYMFAMEETSQILTLERDV